MNGARSRHVPIPACPPGTAVELFRFARSGRIFSPKYESISKTFKPCHVIVFASFIPDHAKLSQDRWLDSPVLE